MKSGAFHSLRIELASMRRKLKDHQGDPVEGYWLGVVDGMVTAMRIVGCVKMTLPEPRKRRGKNAQTPLP